MTDASLKLQGAWEVCRKFEVSTMTRSADAAVVEKALAGVAGVRGVSVSAARRLVTVRYEITEADYKVIRDALAAAGFASSDGWWARRKAAWYQSLDQTGRDNAGVKASACCNKPPVIRR